MKHVWVCGVKSITYRNPHTGFRFTESTPGAEHTIPTFKPPDNNPNNGNSGTWTTATTTATAREMSEAHWAFIRTPPSSTNSDNSGRTAKIDEVPSE